MTVPDRLLVLWHRTEPRVERAIRNADTFRDGYSSGSGGSGGKSDRTGTLASRHLDLGDRHGQLHRDLHRTLERLADLVDLLAPNQARAAHAATQAPEPDGCRSCARAGRWSPIHAHGLCQNCPKLLARVQGRYVYDQDMPPTPLVELVARGVRVTEREMDRVMHGHKRRD